MSRESREPIDPRDVPHDFDYETWNRDLEEVRSAWKRDSSQNPAPRYLSLKGDILPLIVRSPKDGESLRITGSYPGWVTLIFRDPHGTYRSRLRIEEADPERVLERIIPFALNLVNSSRPSLIKALTKRF